MLPGDPLPQSPSVGGGTASSNPAPSSGESANFRYLSGTTWSEPEGALARLDLAGDRDLRRAARGRPRRSCDGAAGLDVVRLPAIAEEDERNRVETVYGGDRVRGPILWPQIRRGVAPRVRPTAPPHPGGIQFCRQYQQAPTPLGGGMIKAGG